mgnify:CR=1 FL=1
MEFDNKTVYVLDSYGLIFRCYFAFINRPLTNSKGENISALFGFFRNFHYILQHYKPGYIIAAMDSKTKTFRHEMYDQYKATRNKTPEDLHAQIPWICEILEALGIPVLQCDGYEADDVIATVAKKCAESGRSCRILSGDKDLMQLVNDSTQILKPENGGGWKVTGVDGVVAEWGVKPAELLDLLALYGDTADNIPGVHGVGVKTAGKLIADYGNLDGIYAHIDEIKGAMKQKLLDGKENAYFSQKLVKLCDEVPCPDIDAAIFTDEYKFNYAAAAEALKKYGAMAVARQYAELAGVSTFTETQESTVESAEKSTAQTAIIEEEQPVLEIKQNKGEYKAVTSVKELEAYISEFLKSKELTIAYDSETDGLDTTTSKILGFSLSYEKGKGIYVPLQQEAADLFSETNYIEKTDAFTQLARIFNNDAVTVIMHNAKFDLKVLVSNGYTKDFSQIIKCRLIDTMLIAWLISPDAMGKASYGLEYLCETKLGIKGIEFSDIVPKGQTFADVPLETAASYAAEDADFTFQLWKYFEKQIEDKSAVFTQLKELLFNLELPLIPVLTQMELNGIHLDTATLHAYNKELTIGIEEAEKAIHKEVGHEFNIASPKQLQTVLFEERGLKPGKKTKTGYSTDTSVLEELAEFDVVPKMILEYREMAKLQSTYVETLPTLVDNQGRIHTTFVQTGTATGRLSCRDPNLQNIPVRNDAGRRIRSAFTAPEGKVLISADYSQIELVVLAHLSGDKNMCNAFTSGTDVHKATAAMIFGVSPDAVTPEMRRTAKTINFGVIYGMSAFSLAKDLGISRTQAQTFIDMYFSTYSSVSNFMTGVITKAEETGYVETMFGRRRQIMNINSRNKLEKSGAERMAKNTPIQGTAADIVKKAMLNVSKALKETNSPAKLLLQVHDELIFECPDNSAAIEETIALIRDKMENAVKLSVPLKVSVEYGKNWGEFH